MCRDARDSRPAVPVRTGIAAAIAGSGSPGWFTGLAPKPALPKAPQLRKKLWELPRNLHCSVVGTCLTTPELRKVLGKFAEADLHRLSELDLHEQGVTSAGHQDDAGRALHKALDRRHEAVVKRFARADDPQSLRRLWQEARQGGDLPGAYWAVLTHAATTDALVHEVFGDVHMLSHLVGSANRAALSRIAELEECQAEIENRRERQQARLEETFAQRDAIAARLDQLLIERSAQSGAQCGEAETVALRELVESLHQRLAGEIARRERADQKREESREALLRAQRDLAAVGERARALDAEAQALEELLDAGADMGEAAPLPVPEGAAILYVGGRPAQVEQIRVRLAASGAELLHHDGGLQERVGMLAGLISRADLVVFPVDCISHGAMHAVKRLCGQAGKPYLPLRSAGLASFVGGLRQAPELATEA